MNHREKVILIVAGLAVGALALDSVIISPLWNRATEAKARVSMASKELANAERVIQRAAREQRRWQTVSGQTIRSDVQNAEGQLLNIVPQWASSARFTLTSLRPERGEMQQGFGQIVVRATGTGDLESVGRFLYAVQNASVPVRVASLQLSSRQEGTGDLVVQVALATIYLPPAEPTGGQP